MRNRIIVKRVVILAVAGLIIGTVVRGGVPFGSKETMEDLNLGIPTRMMQVERKDLVSTVRYRGTVEANGSVTLMPKVTANIRDILVEEGDWVQAGDVLVTLDDRTMLANEEGLIQKMEGIRTTAGFLNQSIATFENTNPQAQKLESARGQYAFLETEVEKMGILLEQGAISQDTFNKVQLEKETAGHQVRELEAMVSNTLDQLTHERNMAGIQLRELEAVAQEMGYHLEETQVVAPVSGTVRQIFYQSHDLYRTGTPLIIIDDTSDHMVKVSVGEKEAARIGLDDPVLVILQGHENQLTGKVTKTPAYLHPVARTGEVEVTLEKGQGTNLVVGASASVDFIHQRVEDGLVIPSAAIKTLGNRQLVYVIRENTVEERDIVTGLSAYNETLVLEGLEELENIAVQNLNQLYHGAKVFVFEGAGSQ
ncbi:MAG: efflux RND transporter periplasmic adaptor subunit [Bacillota bacterium]|nr:efflux RND transporter periplasmic adaptor subunit [Bacillota bacterium]MDW7676405.1 efflux RND transporter periplasmic adaptor subunit [Bacillota bacterium]